MTIRTDMSPAASEVSAKDRRQMGRFLTKFMTPRDTRSAIRRLSNSNRGRSIETSPILYEQMVGRGMRGREFGGTERCLVIDVDDNIQRRNDPVTVEYESLEREMRHAD